MEHDYKKPKIKEFRYIYFDLVYSFVQVLEEVLLTIWGNCEQGYMIYSEPGKFVGEFTIKLEREKSKFSISWTIN